jgi:hypothetical protein
VVCDYNSEYEERSTFRVVENKHIAIRRYLDKDKLDYYDSDEMEN